MMGGEYLSEESQIAIETAAARSAVYVSPISAWEIGLLQAKGRIVLRTGVEEWFAEALRTPGFAITELSVPILVRSTNLPGNPPPGPVDRILIATCRQHGLSIVTRDRKILAYAEQGYIAAVAC